jgi:hypothetical protein
LHKTQSHFAETFSILLSNEAVRGPQKQARRRAASRLVPKDARRHIRKRQPPDKTVISHPLNSFTIFLFSTAWLAVNSTSWRISDWSNNATPLACANSLLVQSMKVLLVQPGFPAPPARARHANCSII